MIAWTGNFRLISQMCLSFFRSLKLFPVFFQQQEQLKRDILWWFCKSYKRHKLEGKKNKAFASQRIICVGKKGRLDCTNIKLDVNNDFIIYFLCSGIRNTILTAKYSIDFF